MSSSRRASVQPAAPPPTVEEEPEAITTVVQEQPPEEQIPAADHAEEIRKEVTETLAPKATVVEEPPPQEQVSAPDHAEEIRKEVSETLAPSTPPENIEETPQPVEEIVQEPPEAARDAVEEEPTPVEEIVEAQPSPVSEVLDEQPMPVQESKPPSIKEVLEEQPKTIQAEPSPVMETAEEKSFPVEEVNPSPVEEVLQKQPTVVEQPSPIENALKAQRTVDTESEEVQPSPFTEVLDEKQPIPLDETVPEVETGGTPSPVDEVFEKTPSPTQELSDKVPTPVSEVVEKAPTPVKEIAGRKPSAVKQIIEKLKPTPTVVDDSPASVFSEFPDERRRSKPLNNIMQPEKPSTWGPQPDTPHVAFRTPTTTTQSASSAADAEALAKRSILNEHEEHHSKMGLLVRDAVIGMSDGITVPFALVAGLSAMDNRKFVVVGGLAELFAGAISMGLGAFLAGLTDRQRYKSEEARERREVKEEPEAEEAEIYDILGKYNIPPENCRGVVESLKQDEDMWVQFMMDFELKLEKPSRRVAWLEGLVMGTTYLIGGIFPLIPFLAMKNVHKALYIAIGIAAAELLGFGFAKSRLAGGSWKRSLLGALQTLMLGALAAAAAYFLVASFADPHHKKSKAAGAVAWDPKGHAANAGCDDLDSCCCEPNPVCSVDPCEATSTTCSPASSSACGTDSYLPTTSTTTLWVDGSGYPTPVPNVTDAKLY